MKELRKLLDKLSRALAQLEATGRHLEALEQELRAIAGRNAEETRRAGGSGKAEGKRLKAEGKSREGTQGAQEQVCRVCGCTNDWPCFDSRTGDTCGWVAADLCSMCEDPLKTAGLNDSAIHGSAKSGPSPRGRKAVGP